MTNSWAHSRPAWLPVCLKLARVVTTNFSRLCLRRAKNGGLPSREPWCPSTQSRAESMVHQRSRASFRNLVSLRIATRSRESCRSAESVRKYHPTTMQSAHPHVADLLEHDFTADRPPKKRLCDVSHILTTEGFRHLACVLGAWNGSIDALCI